MTERGRRGEQAEIACGGSGAHCVARWQRERGRAAGLGMVAAILPCARASLAHGDTWRQEMVACWGVLVVGRTSRQATSCETSDA